MAISRQRRRENGLRQSSSVEDLPDLLTAKDLERLLKIDVKTIYSYAQKGSYHTSAFNQISASKNPRFSIGWKNIVSARNL